MNTSVVWEFLKVRYGRVREELRNVVARKIFVRPERKYVMKRMSSTTTC